MQYFSRFLYSTKFLLFFLVLNACKTRNYKVSEIKEISFPAFDATKRPYDVQDLALLFPRKENGLFHPDLLISDFVPQKIFDDLIQKSVNDAATKVTTSSGRVRQVKFSKGEDRIENWRIVGFRIKPCVLTRKAAIKAELAEVPQSATAGFPQGCVS